MLDVFDFIVEKGGNPEKIKESQRRRYAPEAAVDEVIALYEDHRKSKTTLPIILPLITLCSSTNTLLQHNIPSRRSIQKSTTHKNKSARRRRQRKTQMIC
jgi:seryl-tRNA synthetase